MGLDTRCVMSESNSRPARGYLTTHTPNTDVVAHDPESPEVPADIGVISNFGSSQVITEIITWCCMAWVDRQPGRTQHCRCMRNVYNLEYSSGRPCLPHLVQSQNTEKPRTWKWILR